RGRIRLTADTFAEPQSGETTFGRAQQTASGGNRQAQQAGPGQERQTVARQAQQAGSGGERQTTPGGVQTTAHRKAPAMLFSPERRQELRQRAMIRDLITGLARYRRASGIRRDAESLRGEICPFLENTMQAVTIRTGLRWLFSGRRAKEETVHAIGALLEFCRSPRYGRMQRFIALYRDAAGMDPAAAQEDFRKNSAAYYALAEKIAGAQIPQELVYSSIPAQLAAQINAFETDLSGFHGDLRAYQAFGVRYILAQKRVLLGDEMGLGKTIQAIAAMTHLWAVDPSARFLIVCPASVMINWCREIARFSDIEPHLVHGTYLLDALAGWKEHGGAAVTNYESMGRIVGQIDNQMRLALLVIDEAHYIKNPQAQRTKHIHALEDESERILMMTGTPLENRVDEMCELIGFVRPDLVPVIRENAAMRHFPAFREMLAPAYLRRQREQVLTELPPLTEEEEWCAMSPEDRLAYGAEVMKHNFTGMRQVSFLQENMRTSSKAQRLLELCGEARDEGRRIVIYSYFRETIRKVSQMLEEAMNCSTAGWEPGAPRVRCFLGIITGSTPVAERQDLIDRFADAPAGSILVCQVQAGGTGLNIQTAGVVIFCEPQIKPSLMQQAISRVYRMGQLQNVLVYHLLCENTVDEAVMGILAGKQAEFDLFAHESVLADAADNLADKEWIRQVIEEERRKYLPAVIPAENGGQE
ncbi:MAG: DEAD/DEAH box helicase, partial [Eubacteriales bacterium]|nr:DEAD/DEAH box helicase [Eubacteriales bacterium]